MKTSMSIGKNAKPGIDNSSEMIFMTGILLLSFMYITIDLELLSKNNNVLSKKI